MTNFDPWESNNAVDTARNIGMGGILGQDNLLTVFAPLPEEEEAVAAISST